jgi:hypothetical protein
MKKTMWSDGSTVTNVFMKSNDGRFILLTRQELNFNSKSMLLKIDGEEISFFDRDGGNKN